MNAELNFTRLVPHQPPAVNPFVINQLSSLSCQQGSPGLQIPLSLPMEVSLFQKQDEIWTWNVGWGRGEFREVPPAGKYTGCCLQVSAQTLCNNPIMYNYHLEARLTKLREIKTCICSVSQSWSGPSAFPQGLLIVTAITGDSHALTRKERNEWGAGGTPEFQTQVLAQVLTQVLAQVLGQVLNQMLTQMLTQVLAQVLGQVLTQGLA